MPIQIHKKVFLTENIVIIKTAIYRQGVVVARERRDLCFLVSISLRYLRHLKRMLTCFFRKGSTGTIHRINGTQLPVRYYIRVLIYRFQTTQMHYLERNIINAADEDPAISCAHKSRLKISSRLSPPVHLYMYIYV